MTGNYNKTLTPEQRAKLRQIKHLALDMDGTIYMENNIFPFTIPTLDALKADGVGHSFLIDAATERDQTEKGDSGTHPSGEPQMGSPRYSDMQNMTSRSNHNS